MRRLSLAWSLWGLSVLAASTGWSQPVRQSGGERHQAPAVWLGTVTVNFVGGGLTETMTGTLKYEYSHTLGPEDYYDLTGVRVTWTASGGSGGCVYSGGPTVVAVNTTTADGDMIVRSDGRYTINNWLFDTPGTVTATCPGGSFTFPANNQSLLWVPFLSPYFYLSDSATRMRGTYTDSIRTWEWDLTSKPPQLEVELVDYADWRPLAGANESQPGNALTVKARLLKADGTEADVPPDTVRYELTECSQVPGIAMNYPPPGQATDAHDLQFTSDLNPGAAYFGPDGQSVGLPGAVNTAATLASFDYGGFGTLKVTALVDGAEIVGYLKGDPAVQNFRVPKREPNSYIADDWLSKQGVTGNADDSDTDAQPAGDNHPGDGYTLYEEYRGFIENGSHLSTNPKKKDFFIFDKVGGKSKQGIGLFKATTKLEVHHELLETEFPAGRIMNANNGGIRHLTDEHGILIEQWGESFNRAEGGPGTPKKVARVAISPSVVNGPVDFYTIRAGGRIAFVQVDADVYTHELGHAVNIFHHGDNDLRAAVWSIKRDPNGVAVLDAGGLAVILENGSAEITLFLENGERIVPDWLQGAHDGREVWIGVEGGQHSGNETCFTRYRIAHAYETSPGVRVLIRDPEVRVGGSPPNHFCTSPTGTGVNSPSRSPRPRFGDATQSASLGRPVRGSCRNWICVNDNLPDH